MTVAERNKLLNDSVPVDPTDPHSRRFTMRRTESGLLEVYDIKHTQDVNGEQEFHGHPASRVHRAILKQWRDEEMITTAEYRRLSRKLPGC